MPGWHWEGDGLQTSAAGRDDLRAVVCDAIGGVGRVGAIESLNHFCGHGRAVDRQRANGAGVGPAHHTKFAQPVDVVGVRMGKQDGFDAAHVDREPAQVARAVGAGVKEEEMRSCLDRDAWS